MSAVAPFQASFGPARLAANILRFARLLRFIGLPVGPGKVIDAVRAVEVVNDLGRETFYWTLHAVLVERHEHREIFHQAFDLFWRVPSRDQAGGERNLAEFLPAPPSEFSAIKNRILRAMGDGAETATGGTAKFTLRPKTDEPVDNAAPEESVEAYLAYSPRAADRARNFDAMTDTELRAAEAAIARLSLPHDVVPSRRSVPDPTGRRIDLRATLRAALRSGGEAMALRRRRPRLVVPPVVVLCDISGSMSVHARLFLHFVHALMRRRPRVHGFLFGTELTNVTRAMQDRDVDGALVTAAGLVPGWSGGTRIGASLRRFNLEWGRRVLGQGAVVLLVTDGLDRGEVDLLEAEMDRLRLSCRRLIWLNPLLGYGGYEPVTEGAKAILRHVDEFRPAHNLASLDDLVAALSGPVTAPGRNMAQARAA